VIAFSGNDKTELDRGALLTIDNMIDATTGSVKLKAIFPNKDYQLWPGQFFNVQAAGGHQ